MTGEGLTKDLDYYIFLIRSWNEKRVEDVFEWYKIAVSLCKTPEDHENLSEAYAVMPGMPKKEDYERLCDTHDTVVTVDKSGGIWRIVGNHQHEIFHLKGGCD